MKGNCEWLAEQFETHRIHLRAVAYRMLGSRGDANDAVQETWLRVSRAGAGGIENLGGWLTTILSRVCLDMLHSQKSRREKPLDRGRTGASYARLLNRNVRHRKRIVTKGERYVSQTDRVFCASPRRGLRGSGKTNSHGQCVGQAQASGERIAGDDRSRERRP